MNRMRNVIPAIWIQSFALMSSSWVSILCTDKSTHSLNACWSLSQRSFHPFSPMIIASVCQNFYNCPEKISSQFILYVKARWHLLQYHFFHFTWSCLPKKSKELSHLCLGNYFSPWHSIWQCTWYVKLCPFMTRTFMKILTSRFSIFKS